MLPWLQAHWQRLAQAMGRDRLPHALLIHGPAGVGKRALAEQLLRAALCQDRGAAGLACGQCSNCRLVEAGTHPDLHRVSPTEDSRQIKVDQIRELSRKVALTSSRGAYQVFVLDPADAMNANAANAVLKTLEEPRPGSLLILLANARHRLPVTILSRCQAIHVEIPPADLGLDDLRSHCQGDDALLNAALAAAGGAPLRARGLLDSGELDAYRGTVDDLAALGTGQVTATAVAERWLESDPAARLDYVAGLLRELSWCRARGQAHSALTVSSDLASLASMVEKTNRTRQLLESNLRPELLLESLLIDWGQLSRQGES